MSNEMPRFTESSTTIDSSVCAMPNDKDGEPDLARLRKLKELSKCKKLRTDKKAPNRHMLRIDREELEVTRSGAARILPMRLMPKRRNDVPR